ncbi:MAG: hypothetical protein ACT6S0_00725 [Roseateles sp.]|uniref:hypothetical protein n=1 Tax=Roseateles sp. TaxID=1971397 RepID=UPI0040372E22
MVSRVDDSLDEALSAVMDGRATPAEWARVNAAWAGDAGLRERWALWHAAADGLRSAELPRGHREPEALLAGLHAQMQAAVAEHPRRRDWFAPFAVAAGFVAMALGVSVLGPTPAPDAVVAAAPATTPRAQGLSGLSFAQTAAGRTLPVVVGAREAGLPGDPSPETIDWGLALPEPAASEPHH